MTAPEALRIQLARLLDWEDAHVGFDTAVADLTPELRGVRPSGLAHSVWEIVEHIRIAQHDILSFCVDPHYRESQWPDDYWPTASAPPDAKAWDQSVAAFHRDREALKELARDAKIDLFARIPHGSGQTYLREVLLVADHGAYHVAQIVDVRRALGAWG